MCVTVNIYKGGMFTWQQNMKLKTPQKLVNVAKDPNGVIQDKLRWKPNRAVCWFTVWPMGWAEGILQKHQKCGKKELVCFAVACHLFIRLQRRGASGLRKKEGKRRKEEEEEKREGKTVFQLFATVRVTKERKRWPSCASWTKLSSRVSENLSLMSR